MDLDDAKSLKKLEEKNRRLKKLLAEKEFHMDVLKEANSKNGGSAAPPQSPTGT